MFVSIIIPTHNRCHLLLRALHSVFAQSYQNFEVIIVDDGSSDATRTLVQTRYHRCHYIYQPHKGVSAARNRGIQQAKGQWLAFLDSDDEWLPTKLQEQITAVSQQPDYKNRSYRVNAMKKHAKSGGWIFEKCLPLCAISPSSVVIHSSVFKHVGLFNESLPACEDYDLWLRICAHYPVLFLERALIYKYGGHADQLSSRYWGMDRFRIQALQGIIESRKLSPKNKDAALKTLRQKLHIYLKGAYKRNKIDEIHHYENLRDLYC